MQQCQKWPKMDFSTLDAEPFHKPRVPTDSEKSGHNSEIKWLFTDGFNTADIGHYLMKSHNSQTLSRKLRQ